MAGLFDTFTVAKRGLSVQQANINTTAHNIANANTKGYSRQRAVSETTKPFGGMSKFDSCSVGQVGTGAEITAIQRIRDSFIDYQVRSETGTMGNYNTISKNLSEVQNAFGEDTDSDSGINTLLSEFVSSFTETGKTSSKVDVKTVAKERAKTLAEAINYTYNQLEKIKEENQTNLQADVTDVNSCLNQINELNKQISSISSVGQTPNDLMDKRDNLLDELSNKFGIKITNQDLNTIDVSSTEYSSSVFVKSNPNDVGYSRLSYVKSAEADSTGKVTVEYYPLGNKNAGTKTFTVTAGTVDQAKALAEEIKENKILIADKDGYVGASVTTDPYTGSDLDGVTTNTTTGVITVTKTDLSGKTQTVITPPANTAALKTKIFQTYKYESGVNNVDNKYVKGDIAGRQSTQALITTYMDNLDSLAKTIAYTVNAIQTGSTKDGDTTEGLEDNLIFVAEGNSRLDGSATDTGINASNIRVNSKILSDASLINADSTSSSGNDGLRGKAISNLSSLKMNITSGSDKTDRDSFLSAINVSFTADSKNVTLSGVTDGTTMNSYYLTIISNIAVETQEAGRQVDIQETRLADLEQQKLAVSGVSLDEEMTDLIQFQHAYQANAKMISTIDELLDVVINGLKR